jgi:hypothetical protein
MMTGIYQAEDFLGINTILLIMNTMTRNHTRRQLFVFFLQFDEMRLYPDVAGNFLKSYPMKFVKGRYLFAACLPICSEKDFEAIYVYTNNTKMELRR